MNTRIDEIGVVCYVCNKGHIKHRIIAGTKREDDEYLSSLSWECDNPECKTSFIRNREGDFYIKQIY